MSDYRDISGFGMSNRKLVPFVNCISDFTRCGFWTFELKTSQKAKSVLSKPSPITWANISERLVSETCEQVSWGNTALNGPIALRLHIIIALDVKYPDGFIETHPEPKLTAGKAVLSICNCETSQRLSLVFIKPKANSELDWPGFIGTIRVPNTSDDLTTPRFLKKKSFVNSSTLSEVVFGFAKNANVSLGFCGSTFGSKSTFVQNPKATTINTKNSLNVVQAVFFHFRRSVETDCTTANTPNTKESHHAQIVKI